MTTSNIKAKRFGEVTLIHADSIADAKKFVVRHFKESKLKLEIFEEEDANLYFCATKKRIRNESYYIYVVLNSEKFATEKKSNA